MVKILALNGDETFLLFKRDGFEVTTETQLGNYDSYKAPKKTLKEIARVTKEEKFDFVVIKNNMGVGVEKANAVDQSMRDKVIIVWNSEPSDSEKRPYQELSVKHFTTVLEFTKYLKGLIEKVE